MVSPTSPSSPISKSEMFSTFISPLSVPALPSQSLPSLCSTRPLISALNPSDPSSPVPKRRSRLKKAPSTSVRRAPEQSPRDEVNLQNESDARLQGTRKPVENSKDATKSLYSKRGETASKREPAKEGYHGAVAKTKENGKTSAKKSRGSSQKTGKVKRREGTGAERKMTEAAPLRVVEKRGADVENGVRNAEGGMVGVSNAKIGIGGAADVNKRSNSRAKVSKRGKMAEDGKKLRGKRNEVKQEGKKREIVHAFDLEGGLVTDVPLVGMKKETERKKTISAEVGTAGGGVGGAVEDEENLNSADVVTEATRVKAGGAYPKLSGVVNEVSAGDSVACTVEVTRKLADEQRQLAAEDMFRNAEELVDKELTFRDGRYGSCFQCGDMIVIPGLAQFFCRNCGWLCRTVEAKTFSPGHHD